MKKLTALVLALVLFTGSAGSGDAPRRLRIQDKEKFAKKAKEWYRSFTPS